MAQVETSVPVKPLSVAGEALTTEETRVVRSPWDGASVAAVPVVGALETRAAIDAAAQAMATPLPAHEVGPALAAGCGTVLKPAGVAPLAAIELVDLLHEAGLPRELLSVVTGPAEEIGDVLVEDERVRMITFTGSAEVGWKLAARAARKHVSLELGNSTPLIVCVEADL